jgi:hypothetical protein
LLNSEFIVVSYQSSFVFLPDMDCLIAAVTFLRPCLNRGTMAVSGGWVNWWKSKLSLQPVSILPKPVNAPPEKLGCLLLWDIEWRDIGDGHAALPLFIELLMV